MKNFLASYSLVLVFSLFAISAPLVSIAAFLNLALN